MARTEDAGRAVPGRDAGLAIGLLLVGVVHVTYLVAMLRDLPETINVSVRSVGITAGYTRTDIATATGWIASGSLVVALALAIGFTVPRIRTGRSAWWIPVVCAAIGWTVAIALYIAALLADPAVANAIMQQASRQS